eukprot:403336974
MHNSFNKLTQQSSGMLIASQTRKLSDDIHSSQTNNSGKKSDIKFSPINESDKRLLKQVSNIDNLKKNNHKQFTEDFDETNNKLNQQNYKEQQNIQNYNDENDIDIQFEDLSNHDTDGLFKKQKTITDGLTDQEKKRLYSGDEQLMHSILSQSDMMSSFLCSEDQASFLKPKERLMSITDLLDKRNNKFKEFEHLIDPKREQLEEDYKKASNCINDIKINEKIWVRFDENDEIFMLSECVDERFKDHTSAECNACLKPNKKLSNCEFCGTLNCPTCINKSRPFPQRNPQKAQRGQICIVCNKKFLYRDAMHEFAIKLDMKQGLTLTQQEELIKEEDTYNKLMKDLSDLHELKQTTQTEFKLAKQDCQYEEERIYQEIDKLRKEKDYFVNKVHQSQLEYENKKAKVEQIYEDIKKYEKTLKSKQEQCDSLENEVTFCLDRYQDIMRTQKRSIIFNSKLNQSGRDFSPNASIRSARNFQDNKSLASAKGLNINGSELYTPGGYQNYHYEEDDEKDNELEFVEITDKDQVELSPKRDSLHKKLWNKMTRKQKGMNRQMSSQYDMQTEINYDLLSRSDSMKRMTIKNLDPHKSTVTDDGGIVGLGSGSMSGKRFESADKLNRIQKKMQNRRTKKLDQQVNSCQSCEQTCSIF